MFTLIIGTIQPIYLRAPLFFTLFETITVLIFMVEYVLRLWSCTSDSKFSSLIRDRLRFSLTPLAVVDLGAILPTLIGLLISAILGLQVLDLSFVRAVRLMARVAKLSRYSSGVRTLG